MKRRERLGAACARLLFATAACLSVVIFSATTAAQTPAPPTRPTPAGKSVDEDFELNIEQRRITETNYQAATAVEAGGEGGLRLRVGVALRAESIDVLLRNVRGRVRFRASLAPVLRLLEARPARQAQPPASP
jgi:hypothetical protein